MRQRTFRWIVCRRNIRKIEMNIRRGKNRKGRVISHLDPTKNLGSESIRRNLGNLLLPSEELDVDTANNESSWVPKGKRRNVGMT